MKRRLMFACVLFWGMGNGIAGQEKTIYGYVEKATLVGKNLTVSAKLDTGAKSASLSAIHIEEFEKNGISWLRFTVPSKEGHVECVAEYIGKVKIKSRAGEKTSTGVASREPIKRPVVKMKIRLGNKEKEIFVNLANRNRFNYPLLLGRDAIIAFDGLVDPSLAFTVARTKVVSHAKQ